MSASELRHDLLALETERALLSLTDLRDEEPDIMAEMAAIIRETREAYVLAAVTEIAVLRSGLAGRLLG